MTPLTQTKLTLPDLSIRGNCFTTCIASLFDCAIEDVPAFEDLGENWFEPFWQFLRSRGCDYKGCYYIKEGDDWPGDLGDGIDGLFVGEGPSPRTWVTNGHACIYDREGNLVHDPHPSRDGLLRVKHVLMIERNT